MKHTPVVFILLLMGLILFSCKKDPQETLTPKIKNDKVEATATTATFTWTVDWPGKLISVVEVSENEDMSHSQIYGSETETENHNFTVTVPDLKDGTKYFFRYLVWNKYYVDNKFMMEVKSFTTVTLSMPTVMSTDATDVSWTTATAGGKVTGEGNDEVTERGVCWGIAHNTDTGNIFSHLAASLAGTGSYTVNITGLTAGTK